MVSFACATPGLITDAGGEMRASTSTQLRSTRAGGRSRAFRGSRRRGCARPPAGARRLPTSVSGRASAALEGCRRRSRASWVATARHLHACRADRAVAGRPRDPRLAAARAAGVPITGEMGTPAARAAAPNSMMSGTQGDNTISWARGKLSRLWPPSSERDCRLAGPLSIRERAPGTVVGHRHAPARRRPRTAAPPRSRSAKKPTTSTRLPLSCKSRLSILTVSAW